MSEPTTKYAMLLNALCVMQESPAYAVRKGILEQAEQTIVQLERDLAASESRYRGLRERAHSVLDTVSQMMGRHGEDRDLNQLAIDALESLRAVLAGERQAADGLPPQIDRLVVQGLGAQAPLRSRIKVYLDQLAPHAANRAAASLLREAHELLAASEGRG